MGLGTLPSRTDGQTIDDTWYNVLKTAICVDMVPRNSSGVVTPAAGDIGDTTNYWSNLYTQIMWLRKNGFFIGLKPPAGLNTTYDLTFPVELPVGARRVTVLPSGQLVFGDAGALNYALSASCLSFTASGTSRQPVTNLSTTITTSGRPVFVGIIHDATNFGNSLSHYSVTNTFVYIVRDTTDLAKINCNAQNQEKVPAAINTVDAVAAGTYTYKIEVEDGSGNCEFRNLKLVAFEL